MFDLRIQYENKAYVSRYSLFCDIYIYAMCYGLLDSKVTRQRLLLLRIVIPRAALELLFQFEFQHKHSRLHTLHLAKYVQATFHKHYITSSN